ncbi:MAG: zinc-binding dehydrogenase [Lewinellaceae bacterium]|nr:zinc-binding dehydrogenase [Lewinellaceae bacterium]
MKAMVLPGIGQPLAMESWADWTETADHVVVDLRAAALNHRDVWISKGQYAGLRFPIILGSDGAGYYGDREVIINPSMAWGDDSRCQGSGYHILGLPQHGTFAEKVAVPRENILDKPSHLSFAEAAALPLAGLTAYRALFTQGELMAGERVLINGIGGGVALFALQFALAVGATVYVTSGSAEKIERAQALGAEGGISYREEEWGKLLVKNAGGGFDLVIDSAGGAGFGQLLRAANPGGRIVVYGGTQGAITNLSPQLLFWKQLQIIGSTMGTSAEFAAMVKFVTLHQIRPIIDQEYSLAEANLALARMDDGAQFGKIVLKISS